MMIAMHLVLPMKIQNGTNVKASSMDVGGGSGTTAKGIAEAFPHMDCTVFDLTHVVSDLQGSMGTGLAMIIHTEFNYEK
ncbi:hypothetical protein POTOM_044553 [Populus tomentosa]|uniref:O-methyltransferase C-terminal domain-containing protein n=1 Tax=Populus tomentosa TaxID=118781 RepID=A0A8X8CEN7_POPTO|nr:hypothetical protein POTOM_044553 [Populus tomentosa]